MLRSSKRCTFWLQAAAAADRDTLYTEISKVWGWTFCFVFTRDNRYCYSAS